MQTKSQVWSMVCAGVQRSPALPTVRAQADQPPDAVITLEAPADMPPGSASGDTAASKHAPGPAIPGASAAPAVVPTGSDTRDEVQTEAGQSVQQLIWEAGGNQPTVHIAACGPRVGPQPAITPSMTGEAAEAGGSAMSDCARGGDHVSGAPALASIRTGLLPGSMAHILADTGSEAGQPGTPASHRISDVGSEEADEAVTPLAARQADARSISRPATPASAHLTPR